MIGLGTIYYGVGAVLVTASTPSPVPQPPILTPAPAFATLVSGRSAYADGLDELLTTPHLFYSSVWRFVTFDDGGKISRDTSGTESLALDRARNCVSLVASSDDGKSVTRYVADGKTLLCASLNDGKRTFWRTPMQGESLRFPNALLVQDADRMFMGVLTGFALFKRIEEGWLRSPGTVYTAPDGSVIETLPPRDDNGHRLVMVWRYHISPTHRITSREEWSTWQDNGKPVQVRSYMGESLTYNAAPVTPALFSTKPGASYVEAPPPSTNRVAPIPPFPAQCDAKSRSLLLRWVRAWSRFTSYQAQVHVREWEQAQTKESMAPSGDNDREALMDVSYIRPGKLFVYSRPTGKSNAFTAIQNVVSDGKKFAVSIGVNHEQKRGGDLKTDDAWLNDTLRDNGLHDFSEALPRIMRNPRELLGDTEIATYRGVLPLPNGGTAEAVTLTQRFGDRGPLRLVGNVGVATRQQIVTLYFDAKTRLPLRSEFELRWLPTGNPGERVRDMAPNQFRVADYLGLRVDEEPPPGRFDAP